MSNNTSKKIEVGFREMMACMSTVFIAQMHGLSTEGHMEAAMEAFKNTVEEIVEENEAQRSYFASMGGE